MAAARFPQARECARFFRAERRVQASVPRQGRGAPKKPRRPLSSLILCENFSCVCRSEEFPQGLKPYDIEALMSEPFEAQDRLKLRPPETFMRDILKLFMPLRILVFPSSAERLAFTASISSRRAPARCQRHKKRRSTRSRKAVENRGSQQRQTEFN